MIGIVFLLADVDGHWGYRYLYQYADRQSSFCGRTYAAAFDWGVGWILKTPSMQIGHEFFIFIWLPVF